MHLRTESPPVIVKWQRGVPVYAVPLVSVPFVATAAVALSGLVLIGYRLFAGLGHTNGMTDAYAWGIGKTFNTMVLTALGSGSFAIGIAAWIFMKRALHSVMRVALLISFLVYAIGLLAIMVDVGRSWNFWNILLPWRWNTASPWEVSLCMPFYAFFPLLLENTPPVLERLYYLNPALQRHIRNLVPIIRATSPWVVALAYVLPILHQLSLGALMQLAGDRVHPLWQTPLLPLFYVWAAAFIGTATVTITLLLAWLAWKRSLDFQILNDLASLASGLAAWWLAARLLDLVVRGALPLVFAPDWFALVFWAETIAIGGAAVAMRRMAVSGSPDQLFLTSMAMVAGGMIYRYAPPALVFTAQPMAWYVPSVIEILISVGFVALCHLCFLVAVKRLPILPAPVAEWRDVVNHRYPSIAKWKAEHATSDHRPGYAN